MFQFYIIDALISASTGVMGFRFIFPGGGRLGSQPFTFISYHAGLLCTLSLNFELKYFTKK